MRARENMSKTLAPLPTSEPLQLAFMEAGECLRFPNGTRHQKAIPYTIVAQAVEGTYEVRCNGHHEVIEKGGVFVVPTHAPVDITHWTGRRGVMAARWLHLRFSLWGLIDFLSLYEIPLVLPMLTSLRLGKVIRSVLKLQADPPNDGSLMVGRNELALRALRLICDCAEPKEENLVAPEQRLRAVFLHIQQNLPGLISVESLARIAHLSPAQFHSVFKQKTGVSPMRYVRQIRLDAASRYLAVGDRTLSEIAESVGFGDPFHFSHAFKARFRISPREYRHQLSTTPLQFGSGRRKDQPFGPSP